MELLLYPQYWWLPLGTAAFLFALVNLARAVSGKKRGKGILPLISLGCALFSMLSMFTLTAGWVKHEDWTSLMDCVPAMLKLLTVAVTVGLILHIAAFIFDERGSQVYMVY